MRRSPWSRKPEGTRIASRSSQEARGNRTDRVSCLPGGSASAGLSTGHRADLSQRSTLPMADFSTLKQGVLARRVVPLLASLWGLILSAIPMVLLAGVLLAIAFAVIDPIPPRKIVIASGPENGTYDQMCHKYHEILKTQSVFLDRSGVNVVCQNTSGSVENKELMIQAAKDSRTEHRIEAAFIGYLPDREDKNEKLFSLGLIFRQPLWVFYRKDRVKRSGALVAQHRLNRLSQLEGLRISLGPAGSGGHALMTRLLDLTEMQQRIVKNELEPKEAAQQLRDPRGQLDAMTIVASPDTELLKELLEDPTLDLMDFSQAEAYVRKVPNIVSTILPRGTVNLPRNIPDQNIHLLGTAASLVIHDETHPAIQQLLMSAARTIHREPSWAQREGEFPIGKPSWFPLSHEAARFYRQGPTQGERLLPFWLVNFFERMWVALITVLALMAPLSRILPSIYTFQIRSGIFRWYADLLRIEQALDAPELDASALKVELDRVDREVGALEVPLSRAHDLYDLRSHIALVRMRLESLPAHPASVRP